MPTTNPVPSQDPSDLLFNAGKLDEVLNGTGNSFTDRLGVARRTVSGMNADFDAQLADAESDLNVYRADAAASAAQALGYLNTIRTTSYGAYAADPVWDPLGNPPTVGDEYFNTTSNLLKRFNGTTWQASDINTANLAASSGSSLVGYLSPAAGAIAGTVYGSLRGLVSTLDFMSEAQRADVLAGTASIDITAAIQKAVDHAKALQGIVTIVGAGLGLISGTVNFSHGETRKPIYFRGGGYKKTNAGFMFSATVDNSGDVYFNNVYFESVTGSGAKIFSTDYIIRLHTTNCQFLRCDTIWYSGDDVSAGYAYSQACRSVGDTVVGGNGYAFDLAGGLDITFDSLTVEARESAIRFRAGGGVGVQGVRIVNSALEGLSGTAVRIDGIVNSLQIENTYFELNSVGHIVFAPAANAASVIIKGNLFAGTTGGSGIVWPNNCTNAISIGNRSYSIPLHDVSAVTLGKVWVIQDSGYSIPANIDPNKAAIFGTEKFTQGTVSGKTVSTTYLGQFQRLTVQESKSVPNAATTDYTVDFGVSIKTDDFISVQCNTTADVRMTKFYKSGNTVVYSVRNDTGSAQTVTFTICVLKPLLSVIG